MAQTNKTEHIETERKVIHLMLKHRDVVDEMLDAQMGVQIFDPIHQPLVEAIYQAYVDSSNRRLLTREAYREYLLNRPEKIDVMLSMTIFDKCLVGVYAKADDLVVLKKQLIEIFVVRKSRVIFEEYSNECKKLGYVQSSQNLVDKFNEVLSLMETRRTIFASVADLKDEWLERLIDYREQPEKAVRCSIPEIDDAVNIGFRAQHLTLFVAAPGGHKSNVMLNVALNLVESNYPVLFIPLEMDRLDLINRIVANRADVSGTALSNPELLTQEEIDRIRESELWLKTGRLYILDADERTSVATLRREIEKRAMVFKPSVVIVDYVDNLQSDVRYGQRHIEIGEILKSLRFLGKKYGFHIISAAQMGRAAIKALREGNEDAVDSTAIHGSHQYSADSDTIFALMSAKNEPGKIKMLVLKARHGPSGQVCELQVDPSRYRITSTKLTPKNKDAVIGVMSGPTTLDMPDDVATEDINWATDDELSDLG